MGFDANGDGKLSRQELPERFRASSIARMKTKTGFSDRMRSVNRWPSNLLPPKGAEKADAEARIVGEAR